jgi:hypothetical protein
MRSLWPRKALFSRGKREAVRRTSFGVAVRSMCLTRLFRDGMGDWWILQGPLRSTVYRVCSIWSACPTMGSRSRSKHCFALWYTGCINVSVHAGWGRRTRALYLGHLRALVCRLLRVMHSNASIRCMTAQLIEDASLFLFQPVKLNAPSLYARYMVLSDTHLSGDISSLSQTDRRPMYPPIPYNLSLSRVPSDWLGPC